MSPALRLGRAVAQTLSQRHDYAEIREPPLSSPEDRLTQSVVRWQAHVFAKRLSVPKDSPEWRLYVKLNDRTYQPSKPEWDLIHSTFAALEATRWNPKRKKKKRVRDT
jgi:hypothetical protein